MNFGDILKEWDSIEKDERKAAAAGGSAGRPARAYEPPKTREQRTREGMMAWLNRYGTEDKDGREEAPGQRGPGRDRERLDGMKPEAVIDLHGKNAEDALSDLGRFLDDCVRRGLMKVLIIHGKGNHSEGDPVLSGAVARYLEGCPNAGRRRPGERSEGGKGATVLFLKYPGGAGR